MKYAIPKGVFDLLPEDPSPDGAWRATDLWLYVEEVARGVARAYGYREIRTPVFERTELFVRGVGETSDIVGKEMYTFPDKAGRSMTLRPEGTASVIRSFVEKHMEQKGKRHKLYYMAPMFRYERPQAGRFRQHHQFGVELIGDESPEADGEVIDLLCTFYRTLGLNNLTVLINSVGDKESRAAYRSALVAFLTPHKDSLSEDSQTRLDQNPLRILDSKDKKDEELLKGAPSILDFLSDASKKHFDTVLTLLKKLGIETVIEPKLVRGLDYYSQTVFEVVSGELGAQSSIGAGGRYDGLVALLGGSDLPATGFATGLERVIQTMLGQNAPFPKAKGPLLYCIPIGNAAKEFATELVYSLRHNLIPAELDCQSKKVGNALKSAANLHARYALVIGDDEIKAETFTLKELETREECSVKKDELLSFLETQHKGTLT